MDTLDSIQQALAQYPYLKMEDALALADICKLKNVESGEHLVKAGEVNYMGFYVVKGLLRSYLVRPNGEDRTVLLATEGMGSASPESIFHNQATSEYIMAVEPTTVLAFDMRTFEQLAKENCRVVRLYNDVLKKQMSEAVERLNFYVTMGPEQRYEYLLANRTDMVLRVPQIYLASYLGITPVSLSRIRRRMTKKAS